MNNASSRNIDLIDRYLQAVRFWLPKTNRQEDLLAELGEDLRSQIEDKETELGHPLDKAEMAAILKRCGSPMMVAGRLGPQRHLIGPALFPIYEFVLKMVLLWILVPVFIFIVGPVNVANSGGNWGLAVASTLGDLWSGLFIAAGIITLVFAIIERTNAHLGTEIKWDPLKLPPVRKDERKPSLLKAALRIRIWILRPGLAVARAALPVPDPRSGGGVPEGCADTAHRSTFRLFLLSVVGSGAVGHHFGAAAVDLVSALEPDLLQSVLTLIVLNFMIEAISRTPSAYPVRGPAGCGAGFAKVHSSGRQS